MKFRLSLLKNGFLILSWALYDLANQFFVLNVVSLYFVRWLILEKKAPEIFYSISFGISTFFIAALAPILGVISDVTGRRKPPLIFLTVLCVIFTMLLGIKDNILLSLLFFVIANFCCHTATVFYNALMVNIAPKNRIGLISGLGKTFGYIGAILALYLTKPIVLKSGYQATFLPTGILFLLFSLPCLIFIKDRQTAEKINLPRPCAEVVVRQLSLRGSEATEAISKKGLLRPFGARNDGCWTASEERGLIYFLKKDKILEIFRILRKTAFGVHPLGGLLDFLKAAFFGFCAVNAVVLFMSVYATKVFCLNESGVINLIGFSAIFAIVGSLLSGALSDYLGHRRCLAAVFILWIICFWAGAFVRNVTLYWLVGALVGITLGATWVVSRSLAVSLVPEAQIGEVFGLFNLVGYLSAIVGAIFWGLILLLLYRFGEWGYRIALLSLISFMVPGLIFLLRIPVKERKA